MFKNLKYEWLAKIELQTEALKLRIKALEKIGNSNNLESLSIIKNQDYIFQLKNEIEQLDEEGLLRYIKIQNDSI